MSPIETAAQSTTRHRSGPTRSRPAEDFAPDDVLVFEQKDAVFALVGGSGRGETWAGIVEVDAASSLVGRAWRSGRPLRQSGPRAAHVAGPYHARHAVAVPLGDRHVVVFGGSRPLTAGDSELVRRAAAAVDHTDAVPAHKLLADELELVHAVRSLMAYRPENIADTLRHVATVAAAALSCEIAAVRVEFEGRIVATAINLESGDQAEPAAPLGLHLAETAGMGLPALSQAGASGPDLFGHDVASHITLPIGGDPALGALALAHTTSRPRGFTSLCQRIARAVAEAAELLISQAAAREQLAAERDLLARMSGTDPLTGLANRRVWNDEVEAAVAGPMASPAVVVSSDLDGLKAANDRFGHAAGDALIRAAANLLRSCVRDGDLVARVGGDEFAILLRDADRRTAEQICVRIRRAERLWATGEHRLAPRLSLGYACVQGGDLEAARQAADVAMYTNKRRRAARREAIASLLGNARSDDRGSGGDRPDGRRLAL